MVASGLRPSGHRRERLLALAALFERCLAEQNEDLHNALQSLR